MCRFRPLRTALVSGPALLVLLGLVLVCLEAIAADPPPNPAAASSDAVALDKKVLAQGKTGSEIMANLTYLSDVIGPRLTGSAAVKRANEWTAEKMRSYGLSNVHLEAWSIPIGWERGGVSIRLLDPPSGRPLLAAAMGWSPGTNGKIQGDVVILNAKNTAELAAYKGKLKNAMVLTQEPTPIRPVTATDYGLGGPPARRNGRQGDRNGPPGSRQFDPERWQQMRAFRRELGVFLRTEGAAVMVMDAGKPHGLLNMTGSWPGEDRVSGRDPLPSVFMAHEHYALLYRLASRPAPAKTRVEVEISNTFVPGPVVVYNTVGEIKGSEKPDEFVVLGAHLDSWDLGQGTTDNGTGTCVVLEAARLLARSGIKPKRTIRFILFTGEEQGLYGSRAYVKQHKDELPRISMALVHDTGTGKVIGLGLQGREKIKPILEKELGSLKELGNFDLNLRSMGGSDHQSFDSAGVPGFAFQQDPDEYRFTHHSQSDTLDKAKEPNLEQGAEAMALIGLRVANLPEQLPKDKAARQGGRFDPFAPPPPEKKAPEPEKKSVPDKKVEPAKKAG